MRLALITACLGRNEPLKEYAYQVLPDNTELAIFRLTDDNFPPKSSMLPIAQAKIPKMLGWQLLPGFDYYIWVDSSFSIPRSDSVSWLFNKCMGFDIVFFKHPQRRKLLEEKEYIDQSLLENNEYIKSRYNGELYNDVWFKLDHDLYAGGIFIYKNIDHVKTTLKEWFYQTIRYNINDQLSLPAVLYDSPCTYNIIEENILHNYYFKHKNNKPWGMEPCDN